MDLQQKLKIYRLSEDEYQLICEKLGREPEGVEWALFSALWSEHCSYKSSRVHLKKFYSKSSRVLESFGENAGVIDLGEGERVAFKMESHNHPSFIEPYQGAATGVGGILRDIFTMGARPVAVANYLCFGEPQAERMSHLVDGVVRGIGGYGNCVGVPTVTGQTEFDSSYNGNILVNAFALGLFRPNENIFTSKASGVGNYVVYVGAKTGKDGVHGASMASESFDEESESKKPTVQIGDPFFEKLLIESCLEVMAQDLVVAIQDMGAAGLTSSSFEMASKGGVGFRMDLDKVPSRDSSITPEEILLSESQERMLLICEPAQFDRLKETFERWTLDAVVVGEVLDKKEIELYWENELLCAIDPDLLVENAPMYERPYSAWHHPRKVDQLPAPNSLDVKEHLMSALGSVEGTARDWVFDQYDQRVGGATHRDCSDSVGVLRLPDSKRALGIVLGCRPSVMRMDAQLGGMDAVVYPAIELAAKGFEPLAVTDCLNFGNPEKPEVMSEFVAAVEGMSSVCEALDTPVISGNVSLYNETLGKNVTSTPSTGLVGLRPSVDKLPSSSFDNEGDQVFLLECSMFETMNLHSQGQEPKFSGEIDKEKLVQFIKDLRVFAEKDNGLRSTRIVGKFGLSYALARMTLKGWGADLSEAKVNWSETAKEVYYQVVCAVTPAAVDAFTKHFQTWEPMKLGEVRGQSLHFGDSGKIDCDLIKEKYYNSWQNHFEGMQ